MTFEVGRAKTGGRQLGTPNKRTGELKAAVAAAAERMNELIPDAFQGDAHAYLISLYKDPKVDMRVRLDAARAAISYEKPRQASVEVTNRPGALDFANMRSDEIEAALVQVLADHGVSVVGGEPASTTEALDDAALKMLAGDVDGGKPQ